MAFLSLKFFLIENIFFSFSFFDFISFIIQFLFFYAILSFEQKWSSLIPHLTIVFCSCPSDHKFYWLWNKNEVPG